MSSQTTDCCDQCGTETTNETAGGRAGPAPDSRWLTERPVLDAGLPADLTTAATEFYGVGPVETLRDFAEASRAVAGGSVEVTDLCHVEGDSPHRAVTGEETYSFRCFYDGVALARLQSEPVELRTESPGGAVVELEVAADGSVAVTPEDAAMSFGIAPAAGTLDDDPSPEAVFEAVCPWVKAFPSREAYEGWAAATAAPTVGLPLAEGTPVAAELVAEE
ncbi:organomercurial lyase [Haloglomus halophilum]|uniref:organomercurial lyase n=1 Tax=Haloglomus halophilum TaxID=2962672 RepID=UPI0020CA0610|nr:organomercurial lyase [Haloglomus halophilum]